MILTAWEFLKEYDPFIGSIVSGFMNENDVNTIATGRYDLDDGCYVNVDEYETRENYNFEAHHDYIDIHLMIDGEEIIFVEPLINGIESVPYSKEKDVAFYSCDNVSYGCVNLLPGNAVVLFPWDMHAPCNANEQRHNRKLVFKIPVEFVRIRQRRQQKVLVNND